MGIFNKKAGGSEDKKKEKQKSSENLKENIAFIKEQLKDCGDIVFKEFRVGKEQEHAFTLVYTDGMIDKTILNESVLNQLMVLARIAPPEDSKGQQDGGTVIEKFYELVRYGTIPAAEMKEIDNLDDAILAILTGDAVLFIDGTHRVIVIGAKGWPMRGVSEPNTESLIRGPRDGFNETFRVNTALIRRRIRDPKLKLKQMQVGRRSHTDVGVFYIEDIAHPELVDEVTRRIKTIEIDGILESGYIEQLIEDNYLSPFPQTSVTERPDEVAGALLQGKVAIMVDNSPFALVVPTTFNKLFQSPEDYYDRWFIASILRIIRFTAGIISLFLPALYIAVTSYHPGILPFKLVLSIAASREGIPFPAILEAFVMEGTFELLREAGIRLPAPIGSTIGIVGGIVIGSAAVEAGIVSPIMVIVVAITAIASFSIPSYNLSVGLRMLRFGLMLAASILGLYGIMLGWLLILCHLVKLKSFGVPYMAPFASMVPSDLKDTVIRSPLFLMRKRPSGLSDNKIRLKNNRPEIDQLEKRGGRNDQQ